MTQVGMEFIARDKSRRGISSFNRGISTTGRTVKSLSRNILAIAGVGGGMYMLGNVMRSGVLEAAAFEKQMANVSTMLSEQSMYLMPRYNRQLRAMSIAFGEGTETLSKGLYDILSASVAPARALDVLAASAKAAKAGITDTGVAADAITTILNSYSLKAEMAGSVSDKLFAIVTRGKTTFAELAPNIGKVTALAATAGESFDDLGAAIATMTRAGVQTEIAITSLRAVILSFLKPQTDSVEMARKYGVELNSNTLRTIGLTGVMKKLKKATAEELAVIVPTSRAITGFAAAIQKADAMAGDYDIILNSLGTTEKAYQKIADTSAFKLDKLKQEWIGMKRAVGDLMIEPLTGFLKDVAWGIDRLTDNLKGANRGLKEFLDNYNNLMYQSGKAPAGKTQSYGMWAPMAQINAARKGSGSGFQDLGKNIQRDQLLSWMRSIQQFGLSTSGREIKAPAGPAGSDQAAISARTNAQILSDTREYLASTRAMHDKTRTEKIRMLEEYKVAHFGATSEIEAGEKLLNDEILALQRSRVNAMEVYRAELKEDMEDSALYISEQYADAAHSIEGSMSGAFQSMITEGASWSEAVEGFCNDVARAFSRMISDMIARAIMAEAMGVLVSSFGAAAGARNPESGSPTMADFSTTLHSGWVPEGTPSFRRGRGLKSNEMAAVIEKDEMLVPNDQIFRSPVGRGGGGIDFAPQIKMVIVRDEQAAAIEAMDSEDGEKVIVHKMLRNREMLR